MYPGDNKFVFSADTIPICICSNLRLQKVNLIYDSNNMAYNKIPRSNSRYLEIYKTKVIYHSTLSPRSKVGKNAIKKYYIFLCTSCTQGTLKSKQYPKILILDLRKQRI